ncbi:hypothetical protein [Bacillus sp. FJAT-45350]|uniref:hypothetical protein n=1 Tax=Bacillus sp. FJAT-45350 TaxID=2011014 RepID=UPI000BB985D5|nr:hypothetical protein [Bacillus sp. FJAT-45350]
MFEFIIPVISALLVFLLLVFIPLKISTKMLVQIVFISFLMIVLSYLLYVLYSFAFAFGGFLILLLLFSYIIGKQLDYAKNFIEADESEFFQKTEKLTIQTSESKEENVSSGKLDQKKIDLMFSEAPGEDKVTTDKTEHDEEHNTHEDSSDVDSLAEEDIHKEPVELGSLGYDKIDSDTDDKLDEYKLDIDDQQGMDSIQEEPSGDLNENQFNKIEQDDNDYNVSEKDLNEHDSVEEEKLNDGFLRVPSEEFLEESGEFDSGEQEIEDIYHSRSREMFISDENDEGDEDSLMPRSLEEEDDDETTLLGRQFADEGESLPPRISSELDELDEIPASERNIEKMLEDLESGEKEVEPEKNNTHPKKEEIDDLGNSIMLKRSELFAQLEEDEDEKKRR